MPVIEIGYLHTYLHLYVASSITYAAVVHMLHFVAEVELIFEITTCRIQVHTDQVQNKIYYIKRKYI